MRKIDALLYAMPASIDLVRAGDDRRLVESNDLSLQLHKRGIGRVILAGMSANLCAEAHLRQLLEDGFEFLVVKHETAGARHPELDDGYASALVNFGYLASGVVTTDEAVAAIAASA